MRLRGPKAGKVRPLSSPFQDQEYLQASTSRCNEALALFGAEEDSEAVQIMEDVARRAPNVVDAHVALAVSYWSLKDFARAEDEWRVACEGLGCAQRPGIAVSCLCGLRKMTQKVAIGGMFMHFHVISM